MQRRLSLWLGTATGALALTLAACGGGDSTTTSATPAATGADNTTTTTAATTNGASAGALSTGAISAFGSVFVNGHEFDTSQARVVDDDTGLSTTSTAALEVGMAVDVKAAANSSAKTPIADEVHVRPLVRGVVDASTAGTGTLTVLGQSVQLTAATNFSDHRACVNASTSPCAAVTGQSGLTSTSGTTGGSYVTVYGYLYAADATGNEAAIVATLVSVGDAPSGSSGGGVNYKVEGVVNAVGTNSVTIGGLIVDLSGASCHVADMTRTTANTSCASAFSVGQIVGAYGSVAPTLPATTLSASVARARTRLAVETAGASAELDGKVSNVSSAAKTFVIRDVTINASALTTALPAVGDEVRVLGTVAASGTEITATTVTVLHAAQSASYGFEGNVDSVAAGSASGSFVLTVLGQPVTVSATTRLADRSTRNGGSGASAANPFNITTFQSYLAASASQHLLVRAQADAAGALSAVSVTIVPASTAAAIGGIVDATPAPVNSSATGTPTTFALHGIAVSADPSSIVALPGGRGGRGERGKSPTTSAATIAAGDLVLVRGSYAGGTLTVAATTGGVSPSNVVIDAGTPRGHDRDGF